jgi:nucleoid DNA-binding protein
MAVGKDNLARVVSEKTGLNLIDTRILVTTFFDAIKEELVEKKKIELRGFGSFYVKECKARNARNPRTGEKISIAARKIPVFKVSDKLLEKLNEKA